MIDTSDKFKINEWIQELKYKTDSKKIEQRQIIPVVENINRYNSKSQEGIETNNYLDSQKQQYPIYNKNKDIINNIKNKNNYNKMDTCKKRNTSYGSDRNYDDFDWSSLYANFKEVNST